MTKPFKADVLVVKLSGKALTADKALDALFTTLAGSAASAERTRVVLVHGGGVEVDALMRGLGRRIDRIEGLRVSPAEDMAVIAGALAGTCSLKLRGAAQRAGLMPLGLCATGRVVPADPRLGRVGVIEPGDSAAKRRLQALLDAGFTPVISSVGMDAAGALWNINADDAAVASAALLGAPLIFLSDVPGVLDANKHLFEQLNEEQAETLIAEGVISGGMTVKVRAAFRAAAMTGKPVAAASVFDPMLPNKLASGQLPGTTFTLE